MEVEEEGGGGVQGGGGDEEGGLGVVSFVPAWALTVMRGVYIEKEEAASAVV